jgi:hypothetical protein
MQGENSKHYFLGLELGRPQDFTTLAIAERETKIYPTRPESSILDEEHSYQLRHLERFQVGTPYPEVAARLADLLQSPALVEDSNILIDATGVALPVSKMLQAILERARVKARVCHALITTGDSVVKDYPVHRIPRRDLASTLQVLLQSGRLKVAPALPYAGALKAEMSNFQVKVTAPGDSDYLTWREGEQDDLVLAVALACWAGEHLFRVLRWY